MRNTMQLPIKVMLAMALGIASSQAQRSNSSGQTDERDTSRRSAARQQNVARAEPARAIALSAGEIAENPSLYNGRRVIVRAEIGDVMSPHAFTLDEDHLFAGSDLVVLVPLLTPYAMATRSTNPLEGRSVTVVGTVRLFNRGQFERDYGWFSINLFRDPDRLQDWDWRPVIVAESVRTEMGRELVHSLRGSQEQRAQGGTASSTVARGGSTGAMLPLTSIQKLLETDSPQSLFGQRVKLIGVEVQRVLNESWVVIGQNGQNQLLVSLPVRQDEIKAGDRIDISGVIRPVPERPGQPQWLERQLANPDQDKIYISAERYR